jgi:hypothetical protein
VEYTLNSRNVILKQNVINRYFPLLFMDSSLSSWLLNFSIATSIQCFNVQLSSIIGSNYYSVMLDVQWKSTHVIRKYHILGEKVNSHEINLFTHKLLDT